MVLCVPIQRPKQRRTLRHPRTGGAICHGCEKLSTYTKLIRVARIGQSLNNLIYWVSQIVGAVVTGFFLDANFSRKFRAYAGWIWNLVLVVSTMSSAPQSRCNVARVTLITMRRQMAVFGGNYAFQRGFTRETAAQPGYPVIQLHSGKYAGFAVLYAFNAIVDSAWQCYGCELRTMHFSFKSKNVPCNAD